MSYNKMFLQKLGFASGLTLINTSLISVCYVYGNYWFAVQIPLLLIFLFQMVSILLILALSLIKKDRKILRKNIPPLNICYFIPCYNESAEEINNTMISFLSQKQLQEHGKVYVTVCDGRKKGAGNDMSTDQILEKQVFPNSRSVLLSHGFTNAHNLKVGVQVLLGKTETNCPYFVVIKNKNQGKRDSIGIIRRLCHNFNQPLPDYTFLSKQLMDLFKSHMKQFRIRSIEHIVGVDADTVFLDNCTVEMLREIERKPNILATTGMVKVQFTADTWYGKIMEGYQHVEYISGQAFLRNQQNLTQQKINCLPGCLNITRVCDRTCGEEMLSIYLKPPTAQDHIFSWIRGTASEDRHSVMLLLKLYGDCHTTCTWASQALTSVPITPSVFLSQRKRWSLGSATHGLWMVFMSNIPVFERLSSLIFVTTYVITPFFLYSLVTWLSTILRGSADTMFWVMTGLVQIITLYKLSIGIWIELTAKERILYYLCYPIYYLCGPLIGICIWSYSLYYMDDFGWGKTRTVVEEPVSEAPLAEVSSLGFNNFKSIASTTFDANNHHSIPLEICDEILEEISESNNYTESDIQPAKIRVFQHSRVIDIMLTGKMKDLRGELDPNRPTQQTQESNKGTAQSEVFRRKERESSVIMFSDYDMDQSIEVEEAENTHADTARNGETFRAYKF